MSTVLNEGVVDKAIAFRIIKMLIEPFDKTSAYKLGVIDKNGKNLIPYNKLKTTEQRESYGILQRFMFNLKKLLNKLPGSDSYLKNSIAALLLIREQPETDIVDEERLATILECLDKAYIFVEEQILVEKILAEDMGSSSVGPVTNIAGGFTTNISVDGPPTNNTNGVAGKDKKLGLARRKKLVDVGTNTENI